MGGAEVGGNRSCPDGSIKLSISVVDTSKTKKFKAKLPTATEQSNIKQITE